MIIKDRLIMGPRPRRSDWSCPRMERILLKKIIPFAFMNGKGKTHGHDLIHLRVWDLPQSEAPFSLFPVYFCQLSENLPPSFEWECTDINTRHLMPTDIKGISGISDDAYKENLTLMFTFLISQRYMRRLPASFSRLVPGRGKYIHLK